MFITTNVLEEFGGSDKFSDQVCGQVYTYYMYRFSSFSICHVTEGVRNVSLLNEKFKQNVKHIPVLLKSGGILSLLRKDKNLILVE